MTGNLTRSGKALWCATARAALALVTTIPDQGPWPIAASANVSIRKSGATKTEWPRPPNAAAVRSASAAGRVSRSRTSRPLEKIVAAAIAQFAAGVSAQFGGGSARTLAHDLECVAAIGS